MGRKCLELSIQYDIENNEFETSGGLSEAEEGGLVEAFLKNQVVDTFPCFSPPVLLFKNWRMP
jgi:hypothetical protein